MNKNKKGWPMLKREEKSKLRFLEIIKMISPHLDIVFKMENSKNKLKKYEVI